METELKKLKVNLYTGERVTESPKKGSIRIVDGLSVSASGLARGIKAPDFSVSLVWKQSDQSTGSHSTLQTTLDETFRMEIVRLPMAWA